MLLLLLVLVSIHHYQDDIMNDSTRRLLIMFLMGLVIGSIIAMFVGLAVYAERYSGVVCLPEHQFNRLYDIAKPFLQFDLLNNFTITQIR